MIDLVDADGCETYRSADFVPEDRGCCVPLVGVYEHSWDDSMPVEGLAIGEVCIRLSCIGRSVVPVYVRWTDLLRG